MGYRISEAEWLLAISAIDALMPPMRLAQSIDKYRVFGREPLPEPDVIDFKKLAWYQLNGPGKTLSQA